MSREAQYIPTQPGFFMLRPLVCEKGSFLGHFLDPVIAWAIFSYAVYPVEAWWGVVEDDVPILAPDGVVRDPSGGYWKSLDDWCNEKAAEGLL